ncbi:polysaccharide biosynthesis C-terminal domain-containing protein, partial [Patescibacteria group bacterium]|nr:polysaccharide biosynthesis C-terminal domain-containing protein [Patescibacteria group bacterium]
PLFLGASAVFGGILQSFKRFLVYSLGPIMYNLGIIFGALVLTKYFGLLGLAYGVVLGAFFHMAIQVPTAILCGYRWRPIFNFNSEDVSRIFRLMPPRILSLGLSQLNLWVMTVLASFLAVGSITVYNLANNIWSFPLGIFGVSFALAAFPKLSEFAQKKDRAGFIKTFSLTLRQILFFTLPAGIFFIVLRLQIVQIILGAGKFSEANIVLTGQTLALFSLSLFSESLILLFLRGFFAWEDAWRPFLIGLVAVGLKISLAWHFSKIMGAPGLALGFSIGSIVNLIFLFIFLWRKTGQLDFLETFFSFTKIILASLLAGLVLSYSLGYFSGLSVLAQTALAVLVGGLGYLFFAWLLRLKELKMLRTKIGEINGK